MTSELTPAGNSALDGLLQSERVFRLLVDGIHDYAIFVLNPKGVVASWNDAARRIKGYSRDEILGQHFRIFYPAESRNIGKPEYELQVASRIGRFEDEGWRLRKDGSRFWATWSLPRCVIVPERSSATAKSRGT